MTSTAIRTEARATRRRLVDPAGETVVVAFDTAESPLTWLFTRRDRDGRPLISPAEFTAGERFRSDYERAGLLGRTTMNWSALGGPNERRAQSGGAPLGDAALDAKARVRAALDAIGPDLGSIAVSVCCLQHGLSDLERLKGWPQRSGKVVLRLALSALARHYGYDEMAEGRNVGTRAWVAEDE